MFKVIGEYEGNISLENLIENIRPTKHMENERIYRYNDALDYLDEDDEIEKVFIVDKNHPEGEELHCITHSGIVFVLNRRKHEAYIHRKNETRSYNGLITILFARVRQLERYGYKFSDYTRRKAVQYERDGLNI